MDPHPQGTDGRDDQIAEVRDDRRVRRAALLSLALLAFSLVALLAFVVAGGRPPSKAFGSDGDQAEATGWMYDQVSIVPTACPELRAMVAKAVSDDVLSVGEAKEIGGALGERASRSHEEWQKYDGRSELGLDPGPRPRSCSMTDPRHEPHVRLRLLPEHMFETFDRTGR